MISWETLLNYGNTKLVRFFDGAVVTSVLVGNLNGWLKYVNIAFYLPANYHFWLIGGISNLLGLLACRTLSPQELRLHQSLEKFVDAKRSIQAKSDEDNSKLVRNETSAISSAVFSHLGVTLTDAQRETMSSYLFDHLSSESGNAAAARHVVALSSEWEILNSNWSIKKIVVIVLFGIGIIFYIVFMYLAFVKAWNAIRWW